VLIGDGEYADDALDGFLRHRSCAGWRARDGRFPRPPAQFRWSPCRAFLPPGSPSAPAARPPGALEQSSVCRCGVPVDESSISYGDEGIRWIFYRQDMICFSSLILFRIARASRICRSRSGRHQHDAIPQFRDFSKMRRQIERSSRESSGDHAHHNRVGASLSKDIHPKARDSRQTVRQIGRSSFSSFRLQFHSAQSGRCQCVRRLPAGVYLRRRIFNSLNWPLISTCGAAPGKRSDRSLLRSPQHRATSPRGYFGFGRRGGNSVWIVPSA